MTSFPIPLPPQHTSSVAPLSDSSSSPRTPRFTRHRSDTMLSTSSSASSCILQTPETPSILETLSAGLSLGIPIGPSKPLAESSNEFRLRRRASSYEFGALWEESPGDHPVGKPGPSRLSVAGAGCRLCDSPEEGDRDDYFSPAASIAPANHMIYQPSPLHQQTQSEIPQVADPGIIATNPNRPSVTRRASSKLKDTIRLKLGRSKSSFKVLNRNAQREGGELSHDQASQSPSIISSNPSTTSRRQRLKSLISFSQSSNFSSPSVCSDTPSSDLAFSSGGSQGIALGAPLNAGNRSHSLIVPTTVDVTVEKAIVEACNEEIGQVEEKMDRKGKGRAVHLPHPSRIQSQTIDSHNTLYDLSTPILTHELSSPPDMFHTEGVKGAKHVGFEESLPKELKLLVMKKLMESFANESFGRFSGELLGRMELIKMSTVSKSWEALCFDGQLWQAIDLAAIAHLLPVSVLHRILKHSASFITDLSLRGMDEVGGEMLVKALGGENVDILRYDYNNLLGPRLNIQRLDLSGCETLTENDLASIISCCPNLRSLSLRALSAVGSRLMCFIEKIETLEEIDVSYCRALELPFISSYIKRISEVQAKNLRSIRAAGLLYSSNMLLLSIMERCHNLERLDLQGCHDVSDGMFENFHNYCIEYDECLSSLTHLNVSNTPLTPAIFTFLNDHLPNLTHLEMANLSGVDNPDDDDDGYELSRMLKSMPKLRKVDLEDTAGLSGVSDMVLEALTPMEGDVGTTGCELEELKIGYARASPGAIVDLIKGCKKLRVLELDNTEANNSVMREFLRHSSHPCSRLSIIDCHNVTSTAYTEIAASTRARQGWEGWAAVPFGYDKDVEMAEKMVLKTFWGWKRVVVPKGWVEMRNEAETMESRKRARREQEEQDACGSAGESSVGSKWKGKGKGKAKGDVDGDLGRTRPRMRSNGSISREPVGCIIA
ncbi:hypothetical protein C366_06628 [Cryptococcus neoformans Tu401-1]|nr:hypothetical protein C366_06628 [Cryptococcus neoformans var. grubii Tu401-1]